MTFSQVADMTIDEFIYITTGGRTPADEVSPAELRELFAKAKPIKG